MRFSKWHALGNSYLLVERTELGSPLTPTQAHRLCDVHSGIGSDGVLEVVSVDGTRAEGVIWNPDGSTAEMSGNGVRIAARWLAARAGATAVTVSVGPREVAARLLGAQDVEQDMGAVEVGETEEIDVDGETVQFTPVSVGNPHAVVLLPPVREHLLRLGPRIEHHPRFPERTNVQLVGVDGPHELTALVWERGAGETSASGSSAVAVAAAVVARGLCESPVTVHLPGGDLGVAISTDGRAVLTGPAEQICSGEAFF